MAEDATRYFLVIFTAHLVFVLTLNLGRVSAAVSLSEPQLITSNTGDDTTASGHVSHHRPTQI